MTLERETSIRRNKNKVPFWPQQSADLFQSSFLVDYMLEDFVHENAVKRIFREWRLFARESIERDIGVRFPGGIDPISVDIYAGYGLSPRVEKGVGIAAIGTTIV